MEKSLRCIFLLIIIFIISFDIVYAKDDNKTCMINYNANNVNNKSKSFNEIISNCGSSVYQPTNTDGGTWKVVKNDSPYIKINSTLKTFNFSNLANIDKSQNAQVISMMYITPKVNYTYTFIFNFLTDSNTSSGKCCRSLDGNSTKYSWDITSSTCNVVKDVSEENACLAKNGTTNEKVEDKEVCIQSGKSYHWGKRSSINAGSKEAVGLSKEDCNAKMVEQAEKDNKEGNARIEESMTKIEQDTTDTDYNYTGKNSCQNYQITRVRRYNPKDASASSIPYAYSDYFKSPVTNRGVNYYNVYKATCADTGVSVSTFCIDPGLTGPLSDKINYNVSNIIVKESDLWFGLQRLYAHWYVDPEGRGKIEAVPVKLSSGNFDSATVKSDYVDYVLNNVARLLIYNYGEYNSPTISFECDTSSAYGCGTGSWANNEISYYQKKNFNGAHSANNESQKMLIEVWNDVVDYINKNSVETKELPIADDSWIIPVDSYVKLVGDFRKGAKIGYYCNSKKGVAKYNETEFSKNEKGNKNKHEGVDFTINGSDIGKIPVYAAQTGEVIAAGDISNDKSMGNAVVIVVRTGENTEVKTRYLHLDSIESSIYARAKEKNIRKKIIKKGELIGYVGNTGKSSGAHLHFDVSSNDASAKQNLGKTLYSPRDYLPLDDVQICSQNSWGYGDNKPTVSSVTDSTYMTKAYDSVQIEKENINTSVTPDGRGFEASFDIKLSSDDVNALNDVTEQAKWSITAATDKGDNIAISPSNITLENGTFTKNDGGLTRVGKFKVSVPDGLVGISGEAKQVKIKFNISYVSMHSTENILLLTTTEYDKPNGKYQRFVTFLNGTIDKSTNVSIDIPDAESEECNPMFSMMCTPINTVSYLIEGTQSPEIFNKLMSGINTVGDLIKMLNKSTMILEKLKNNNLTSNDLLYIGSLAYNIAGDLFNFTTIQKQLESFLNLEELKNNKTAQRLKNTIVKDTTINKYVSSEKTNNGIWCTLLGVIGADGKCYSDVEHTEEIKEIPDYTKDETRAFIDFVKMLSSAIKGDNDNYQSIKNDWKEILEVSEKYSGQYNKITNFISTISNFVNGMKSKENLNNALDGLKTFGDSLLDGSIFESLPTLDDIKKAAQNMSTAIQGTLQMATNNVGDIINQLKNMISNIDFGNMKSTDISDILNLFTKATTTDWEKCIIGKDDPDGNSYKVQDQNLYCSISCKEDYAFKMPGNLGTVAPGQNLTTSIDNVYQATVGVAGQRTCVTTSIDNNAYQKDAYDKKKEILEKYSELMKLYQQQSKVLSSDAGTTTPATWNTIETMPSNEVDKLINIVESKLKDVFDDTMDEFAFQLLGSSSSAESVGNLKSKLKEEGEQILVEVGGNIVANLLDGKNDLSDLMDGSLIKEQFEKAFKKKAEEYKETFNNALNSAVNYFVSHLKDVATDAAKAVAADVLKLGPAALLTTACHSTKLLSAIPYIGGFLSAIGDGICNVYATVTTTVAPIVQEVSRRTDGLILGYYTPASSSYTYRYSRFDYGTLPLVVLKECDTDYAFKSSDNNYYTNVLKGDIVCIGTDTATGDLNGNEIFIPVLEPGTYKPSVLQLGFTLNLDNLKTGINSIHELMQKSKDLFDSISGFISGFNDPEHSSFVDVLNAIGNPSISSLESILDYVVRGGFEKDADGLNNVFPAIFNYIASNSSYASTALTELIDTSLNAMFNLLGGFSPYYAEIASINNSLLAKKKEYNSSRDELLSLAKNMHDCTVWSNDFAFNPKITFNYGYRYFGAVKDSTTESINLEMINKNEKAEETFYYCDDDVAINDIQSINTILSGRCTTSDGIIGAVLSAFLGDNETFKGISSFISENSSIIRSFMKNDEVKKYLGNYYDKICLLAGEDLCVSSDDVLTTGIPGAVIYKMSNDASLKTTLDNLKNSLKLENVKNGTIFAKLTNAIMSNFTYGPTNLDNVTYRNVGRVVRISRYGNPGVSISGLNMTRFIANMITYVSNYLNVSRDSIVNKLYDALLSVTGEGAQKFVYFRSSKPYFTYSNKGIYTNESNAADDTIPIDYGDKGLTNDNITSGTNDDKKSTGKSYPIALTTKPGTYYYNITFNNIGQYYNNTFSLGRIVDDDGYINGTMANEYSCYYNVEKPTIDNKDDCEKKIENAAAVCKTAEGKFYKDLYKANYTDLNGTDYKAKWSNCINKLLSGTDTVCCDYIKDAVTDTSESEFRRVCYGCNGIGLFACINNNSAICDSLSAISNEYDKNNTGTSSSGNKYELIEGNGSLNFYTKIVSNYDLFPNGETSKGLNWVGSTSGNENRNESGKQVPEKLNDIITEIERKGDTIYDEEPDYYIELDGACMFKIREYNNQSELYDLGFGDYSGSSKNRETRDWEAGFLNDLEQKSEYKECAEAIKNNLN